MTRRRRKLKGYRNRKFNFLSNKYIIGIDPYIESILITPRIVYIYDPYTRKSKLVTI